MPEVVDCRGGERALRPLEVELVCTEDVKDRTQVSEMLRLGGAVDQDVIEEDEDAAAEKRLEDVVHQRLEHRWRVGQAERHHQELKVSVVCPERRLVDICSSNMHLMIARAQIKLSKELGVV
jgi:hypothetical protein